MPCVCDVIPESRAGGKSHPEAAKYCLAQCVCVRMYLIGPE